MLLRIQFSQMWLIPEATTIALCLCVLMVEGRAPMSHSPIPLLLSQKVSFNNLTYI